MTALRAELSTVLREGDRGTTDGHGRQRVRQALVVVEIACALALLVGAGLSLGAGVRMATQSGGFEARHLLRFDLPLPETKYVDDEARRAFGDRLLERLAAIPGVANVALASVLPASGWSPEIAFVTEDNPAPDSARLPRAGYRAVSAEYFETMRVPIVRGRAFSGFDRNGSQPVAIVSASLAARLWPGRDPVGVRMRLGDSGSRWVTVVGVAGDVSMYNWWDGIDYSAIYVPLRQAPPPDGVRAVVRLRGESADAASNIRAAVAALDPLLAVDALKSMQQAVVESTFGLKFMASLIGVSGAIALALSFIGIYSMMSYAVSQRRQEFGVRMALGATATDILGIAVKQAGKLTAYGVAIGLALAATLGYLMSSAIFGLISLDPAIFAGVAIAVAIVSLVGAYVPARRALKVDPAIVLRSQ